MKTKTLILSIGIIFLSAYAIFAQGDWDWNLERDSFIIKTPYIFEGEVIKSEGYMATFKGHKDICTYSIVRIDKLLKGREVIKPGTIEVITRGGTFGGQGRKIVTNDIAPQGKMSGKVILFCKNSPYSSSGDTTDNEIKVTPRIRFADRKDPLWENGKPTKKYGFTAFGKNFTSKEEFYEFLAKYPGVTIPKEEEKK